MSIHGRSLLAICLAALQASACKVYDPLYCDEKTDCTNPDRPFCDLKGEFPDSEGVARTCIPDPNPKPGSDGGTDEDPDGGDAPPRNAFELEVSADIGVEQGHSASLEVRVVRGADFAEPVMVEFTELPAGVSSASIPIPASSDTGILMLTAASDAAQGGPTPATVSAIGGRAVATANVAIMVRGAPGTPDLSFGTAGSTIPDCFAHAVGVQPDGKVIVAGVRENNVAIQRFSLDGSRDATYATGGLLLLPGGGFSRALALQEDGKILVGGGIESESPGFDSLVARTSTNGMLDPEFGVGGKVVISLSKDQTDTVGAIAVLPDGRIVAAGVVESSNIAVFRLNANGEIDSTFGIKGRVVISTGIQTRLGAMAVDNDGRVVIAGSRQEAECCPRSIFVLRVLPTGLPDPDFGSAGIVILPPLQGEPGVEGATSMHVDGDRILVGGESLDDAFVMRLAPDGQIDSTFDGDGFVLFPGADTISGLQVEMDGKIFVIGKRILGSIRSAFASRLTSTGAPDPGFGERAFALDAVIYHAAFTGDGRVVVVGDGGQIAPLFRIWR